MPSICLGSRSLRIVSGPAIDIRVADRISDIVAEVAAEIGQPLLALLAGGDLRELF